MYSVSEQHYFTEQFWSFIMRQQIKKKVHDRYNYNYSLKSQVI